MLARRWKGGTSDNPPRPGAVLLHKPARQAADPVPVGNLLEVRLERADGYGGPHRPRLRAQRAPGADRRRTPRRSRRVHRAARQDLTPTPRPSVMTRQIKYSKIVGAVGFEPTNPSLVRRNTARNTPSSPGR